METLLTISTIIMQYFLAVQPSTFGGGGSGRWHAGEPIAREQPG